MRYLVGKRVVIYRRVSTTEQKDKGSSLETQQERLQDFCSRNEMAIIKDFSEDLYTYFQEKKTIYLPKTQNT